MRMANVTPAIVFDARGKDADEPERYIDLWESLASVLAPGPTASMHLHMEAFGKMNWNAPICRKVNDIKSFARNLKYSTHKISVISPPPKPSFEVFEEWKDAFNSISPDSWTAAPKPTKKRTDDRDREWAQHEDFYKTLKDYAHRMSTGLHVRLSDIPLRVFYTIYAQSTKSVKHSLGPTYAIAIANSTSILQGDTKILDTFFETWRQTLGTAGALYNETFNVENRKQPRPQNQQQEQIEATISKMVTSKKRQLICVGQESEHSIFYFSKNCFGSNITGRR